MPRVTKHEAVKRDWVEHFVYFAENAGLDVADRFLSCAEASFADLGPYPMMGAPLTLKHPDLTAMRKWRINDFNQHLVFHPPRPDGVSIVGVLHASRDGWGLMGFED
ncbi:MAG: type II toxin-antitoxin system RelE/ParE family toxin [Burkholderiales bacterium]